MKYFIHYTFPPARIYQESGFDERFHVGVVISYHYSIAVEMPQAVNNRFMFG